MNRFILFYGHLRVTPFLKPSSDCYYYYVFTVITKTKWFYVT